MKIDPSDRSPARSILTGFRIIVSDRAWPQEARDPIPTVHAAWRWYFRVRGEDPGPESDFARHPRFRGCVNAVVEGVRRSVQLPMTLCGAFLTNQRDQKAFVDRHGPDRFEEAGAFAGIARSGLLYFYWWDGQACYVIAPGDPPQVVTVETVGAPYTRWIATELHRMGLVADLPPPQARVAAGLIVPPGGFAVIVPRLLAREADPVPSLDPAAQVEIGRFLSDLVDAGGQRLLRTYVDDGIFGAYEAIIPNVGRANHVTEDAFLDPAGHPDREAAIRSQRDQQWLNLVAWLRRLPARHRAVIVVRPEVAGLLIADVLESWRRAVPGLFDDGFKPPLKAGAADIVLVFDPSCPSGPRWAIFPL